VLRNVKERHNLHFSTPFANLKAANARFQGCKPGKRRLKTDGSEAQDEVVGLKDAAIPKSAGLSALGEHHKPATLLRIDGDGDALFPTDDIAIAGGNIPDAPRDAVIDHRPLTIDHFGDHLAALGDAAKLR